MLRKFLLVFSFLVGGWAVVYFRFPFKSSNDKIESTSTTGQIYHTSHFYEKEPFEKVFREASALTAENKVYAGVIPHHLLAAPLIASFFKGIEDQEVGTVVLLGPNHPDAGNYGVALSKGYWRTPFGTLEPDLKVANALLANGVVGQEEWLFDGEHSIYGLTTFVKRAFPEARFLPLILKGSVTAPEAEVLGQTLAEILDEGDLVLVSVDFTHEESSEQATANDHESIVALKRFNFDQIYSLKTDSNPSLYTLLSYLKNKSVRATLIEKSNSFELSGEHSESVTSYVTLYFSKVPLFPKVTLESIFASDRNLDSLPPEDLRTLIFTGDVLLARSVNYQIWQHGDPRYPFEKVAEVLRAADLTFINLENPLVENCSLTNEGMIFCGNSRNADGLVNAGIDVVSLANNHTLNYGQAGLENTVRVLEENGLAAVRSGDGIIRDVGGLAVAILAYEDVTTNVDSASVANQIRGLKESSAVVIIYFHWGSEYTAYPSQRQQMLAHLAVESGADLIIGSHPHWIQAVEIYRGVPILYSLGNFVFDQEWSQKTKEGLVARCTFLHDQLIDLELLPVLIENYSQPRWLEGEEGRQILEELEQISRKLAL